MAKQKGHRIYRWEQAELLATRLDRPMGMLGVIFLFVVLGQLLVTDPFWPRTLAIAGWIFWAIFAAEFALRAIIARSQADFWRRNWWQVLFLLFPYLAFSARFPGLPPAAGGPCCPGERHPLGRGPRFALRRQVAQRPHRLAGCGDRRGHPCLQPTALRDGIDQRLFFGTVRDRHGNDYRLRDHQHGYVLQSPAADLGELLRGRVRYLGRLTRRVLPPDARRSEERGSRTAAPVICAPPILDVP